MPFKEDFLDGFYVRTDPAGGGFINYVPPASPTYTIQAQLFDVIGDDTWVEKQFFPVFTPTISFQRTFSCEWEATVTAVSALNGCDAMMWGLNLVTGHPEAAGSEALVAGVIIGLGGNLRLVLLRLNGMIPVVFVAGPFVLLIGTTYYYRITSTGVAPPYSITLEAYSDPNRTALVTSINILDA